MNRHPHSRHGLVRLRPNLAEDAVSALHAVFRGEGVPVIIGNPPHQDGNSIGHIKSREAKLVWALADRYHEVSLTGMRRLLDSVGGVHRFQKIHWPEIGRFGHFRMMSSLLRAFFWKIVIQQFPEVAHPSGSFALSANWEVVNGNGETLSNPFPEGHPARLFSQRLIELFSDGDLLRNAPWPNIPRHVFDCVGAGERFLGKLTDPTALRLLFLDLEIHDALVVLFRAEANSRVQASPGASIGRMLRSQAQTAMLSEHRTLVNGLFWEAVFRTIQGADENRALALRLQGSGIVVVALPENRSAHDFPEHQHFDPLVTVREILAA